jgi:four helix bundle protein
MKVTRFEDIESWKLSKDLATQVYQIFSLNQDFGFRNQITRAVVSISNNIAEWYERKSNNELKQFLYIAKWSAWEVRSMLYIAKELWYCTDE